MYSFILLLRIKTCEFIDNNFNFVRIINSIFIDFHFLFFFSIPIYYGTIKIQNVGIYILYVYYIEYYYFFRPIRGITGRIPFKIFNLVRVNSSVYILLDS